MKFNVTLKGKQTSISVDDVLIDYFGAWLLEESPKLHGNAKEHFKTSKDYIKRLCRELDLPNKNVSQFIQQQIIELIAAPHLKGIIDIRGPRYAPPKRERSNAEPDHKKVNELMGQISAGLKTGKFK